MAATAMIDRLIHHAEILSLKGDSYRLRGKDLDARPTRGHRLAAPQPGRRVCSAPGGACVYPATDSHEGAAAALPQPSSGLLFNRRGPTHPWDTFQPAQLVHFWTGLDSFRIPRGFGGARAAGKESPPGTSEPTSRRPTS